MRTRKNIGIGIAIAIKLQKKAKKLRKLLQLYLYYLLIYCFLANIQADTDESIIMGPNSHLAYVWRSPKARLMLRCSTESAIQAAVWRSSEPFSVREGVIAVRINHDGYVNTLVVTMSCISATK